MEEEIEYVFGREEALPYWDSIKKELKGSQISKAKRFVELGLVRRISYGRWVVMPIKGYNKTSHLVEWNGEKLTCDCQYFNRVGGVCSHILAVVIFTKEVEE